MKVLVVVLNYRTPELVIRCLESLNRELAQTESMHVVVTDNASGDDSATLIQSTIDSRGWTWCTFKPLPRNGGYSYGNNAGIQPFLDRDDAPEYVMLLNPDAYVRPGAVQTLVEFMDANAEVGIAGARVEDERGERAASAFRFPSVTTEMLHGFKLGVLDRALDKHQTFYELGDEPRRVDWVTGAAMMIRRQVFDEVGLLDEGYFLYFDEVDFCWRASQAGWAIHHVPTSTVVHLQAQSTQITDIRKRQPRYPDYWFESRRRFFVKNRGKLRAVLADLAFLTGYSTFRVRSIIQRKPNREPPHFWWDFVRHSTLVRGFEV